MNSSDDIIAEILGLIDQISFLDFSNPSMEDFDELLCILGYELYAQFQGHFLRTSVS